MRKTKITILFILILLIFISCGKKNIQNNYIKTKTYKLYEINYSHYLKTASKENITFSFGMPLYDLNPFRAYSQIELFIKKAIFSSLLDINPEDGSLQLNLLTNHYISNDGLTHHYILKNNIFFNNGKKLTSEDVIASLSLLDDVLKDTDIYKEFYIQNNSMVIEKTSSLSFSIFTENPNMNIEYALANFPIITKELVNQIKGNIENFINFWNLSNFTDIIGTGPFYIDNINGNIISLKRNTYYFKLDENNVQLPYSDTITISFTDNKNKIILDFFDDITDIIHIEDDDYSKLYKYYKKSNKMVKFIDTSYDTEKCLLIYNCFNKESKSFLKDIIIRKYLTLQIYNGLSDKYKDIFIHNGKTIGNIKNEFIDINNDGVKEYKDGNTMFLKIVVPEEDALLVDIAKEIQLIFKNEHIDSYIEILPYHVFMEKIFYKKDYDITFLYHNFYPGIMPYYELLKNKNYNFYSSINDDKSLINLNNILQDCLNAKDFKKQKKNIEKLDKYFKDNYQFYPLIQRKDKYLIRDNIYNFKVNSSYENYINLKTIENIIKIKKTG